MMVPTWKAARKLISDAANRKPKFHPRFVEAPGEGIVISTRFYLVLIVILRSGRPSRPPHARTATDEPPQPTTVAAAEHGLTSVNVAGLNLNVPLTAS